MPWFKLSLTPPPDLFECLSNRFFELGAEGVEEKDTQLLAYFPESLRAGVEQQVRVYLGSLMELRQDTAPLAFTLAVVQDENWTDAYKKFFHAQKLTKLFFLKPLWEADVPVPFGMIPIEMEPGQAFGTGLHASTRLSLRILEKVTRFFPDPAKETLLDVGTGTGILAMAGHFLKYQNVTAVDNDPLAVEAATDNCAHNGCRNVQVSGDSVASLKNEYSVVVSNILLETHRELAPQYSRLCRRGGYLILAGLLVHQVPDAIRILKPQGFAFEESRFLQEWGSLLVRRQV